MKCSVCSIIYIPRTSPHNCSHSAKQNNSKEIDIFGIYWVWESLGLQLAPQYPLVTPLCQEDVFLSVTTHDKCRAVGQTVRETMVQYYGGFRKLQEYTGCLKRWISSSASVRGLKLKSWSHTKGRRQNWKKSGPILTLHLGKVHQANSIKATFFGTPCKCKGENG